MQSTTRDSPTLAARVSPAKIRWGPATVYGVLTLALLFVIAFPDRAEEPGVIAMLLGYGAAGVTLLRKARDMERGRERLSWLLIGTGFLAAAAGITTVGVVQTVTGSIAAFGPTDLFFIAAYSFILTGFATLPQLPASTTQRIRVYLDSLIGALSTAAVLWVLVLGDLIQEFSTATNWDRWAGSAYPILDVVSLMMVVIVTVRRSTFRFDVRLLLFALGITAQSIADLTYLASGVGKTFADASPTYPAYILATILYFSAGSIVDRRPKRRAYADRKAPLWSMIAPYSVALVLVILLLANVDGQQLSANALVLIYAVLIVGGLVICRQAMAIRENRLLVERQRSDLVSSISHELRTPLTAIVGFLDVMTDPDAAIGDQERQELTGIIHEQARHMSGIVSDLILLARGSPDEMTLKESAVPVADLVKRAAASVEKKATSLTVEVEAHLQAMLDAGRVQQVIVNLLSNAVRYGQGKSLIVVRREGKDLAIEVHDNGPGVPKKYEVAIWERFERGANRLNAGTPGSGIGLAVVDAIAKAHGGDTAYRESERLGGACFRVVLPNRIEAA
jgi:signal transduction histidine kinase